MIKPQTEICIADIEKELSKLWEAQKEKKQTRASLFNLIIYAKEKAKSDALHEIVKAIIEKYPCRIIFIEGNPDPSQDYLRVSVTNAFIGKGDVTIVCDQINIEVSDSQLHRIPFVLLPLFIPDLPIFLLWGCDPTTENIILPSMHNTASRLIFDSDCTDNLQSFSLRMLQEIKQERFEIRDMNWAATGAWREIITHVFDTESRIQTLSQAKRIEIIYNDLKTPNVSHPEIQAIYLQAWIAAQLGWQFCSFEFQEGAREIVYLNPQGHTIVKTIPKTSPELVPGAILSFDAACVQEQSFVIARKDNKSQVEVYITTQDRCEMPFTLPLPDIRKASFFMQELFYRKTSNHYSNTLSLLSKYNCQNTR